MLGEPGETPKEGEDQNLIPPVPQRKLGGEGSSAPETELPEGGLEVGDGTPVPESQPAEVIDPSTELPAGQPVVEQNGSATEQATEKEVPEIDYEGERVAIEKAFKESMAELQDIVAKIYPEMTYEASSKDWIENLETAKKKIENIAKLYPEITFEASNPDWIKVLEAIQERGQSEDITFDEELAVHLDGKNTEVHKRRDDAMSDLDKRYLENNKKRIAEI